MDPEKPEETVVWLPHPDGWKLLCLRMDPTATLLQSAANILDDVLSRAMGEISRVQDMREEEVTEWVVNQLRMNGLWPEHTYALKLSVGHGQREISACGCGSNQKHRKRVAHLALALRIMVECAHRQRGDLLQTLWDGHPGLQTVASAAFRMQSVTLTRGRLGDGAAGAAAAPGASASAAERYAAVTQYASMSPAEQLQAKARALGAEEVCVLDPFLTVQGDSVKCMACNKHMTSSHLATKRHMNYAASVEASLEWIKNQPGGPCLAMLQRSGFVPNAVARQSVPSYATLPERPPAPPVPAQKPPAPPAPRPRTAGGFEPREPPSVEEIFDFMAQLPLMRERLSKPPNYMSFQKPLGPLGVEEV